MTTRKLSLIFLLFESELETIPVKYPLTFVLIKINDFANINNILHAFKCKDVLKVQLNFMRFPKQTYTFSLKKKYRHFKR